jgi:hypothetical protein
MKRNKCLTGYVILFMIGSFSTGITLLLTAIMLQQEQRAGHDGYGGASTSSSSSSIAGADPTKHSLKSFATINVRRQLLNQSLPFVQDVVCGGCRSTTVQRVGEETERRGRTGSSASSGGEALTTFRCGDVLRLDSGSAMSPPAAANQTQLRPEIKMTSRQRQELSKMCRPHCYECPSARKRYWRYDRVLVPDGAPIPTLQLLSVPAKHRIPDDVLRQHVDGTSNLTEYLLPRSDQSIFYFDYNPSIVLLPPKPSKGRKWADEDPFEGTVYAASFRVSTMHSCFRPEVRKLMKRNADEPADYVGIALLDSRFDIVQDAVFDVRPLLKGQGQLQDVRLFVLHGQLYLSSHDWIAPVWIGISGSSGAQPPPGYRPVRRVFGNLDQHNMDVWMRSFVSCAGCSSPPSAAKKDSNPAAATSCGKNFNYFALSNDASKALVEVWPSPPHQIRTVDLQSHCQRDVAPERFVDDQPVPSTSASTFSTVEELHFAGWDASAQQRRLLTRGRGGACCVEIAVRDPASGEAKQALVGIQHVKTPPQRSPTGPIIENHYLSRFYAFEPTPPYRMISQSGYFCLGFGTDLDALNEATRWRSLVLGERFEKCPRIHFVSGMTLKSQDPSTLVITYGINDCVSAIAQVPVQTVQQLLSRGPAVLRQQSTNTAQV